MHQSDENRTRTQRVINALLALGLLFQRAQGLPRPLLRLVLWLLRPAERIARAFVFDEACARNVQMLPATMFEPPCANSRTEARRLAISFRDMVWALENMTGLCAQPMTKGSSPTTIRQVLCIVLRMMRRLRCTRIPRPHHDWPLPDAVKIDSS